MNILNPDFDLNTFYWHYAKSDSSGPKTVVTYTVACYDTSKRQMDGTGDNDTPFLIIECRPIEGKTFWTQPEQNEYTVDPRVIEVLIRHFSHEFMVYDSMVMLVEYANGASGELHSHPEFGQAIFGMDLEEAYDGQ
ncbi:MAG: hypothetical protein RR740_00655 [Pseudomonas sp.]